MRKKARTLGTAAAVVLALTFALPALSSSGAGSVSLRTPGTYLRGTAKLAWSYTYGTAVKTTSYVDVSSSRDGYHWSLVASHLPIRSNSYQWNTKNWPDAPYAIRMQVAGTAVYSAASIIYVDNTAPVVKVTRPSQGQVLVEDSPLATTDAVAAGTTTMQADSADNVSGAKSIVWQLDGLEIAHGSSAQYDFGQNPGRHILTAIATDNAGNTASSSISIIALPGPAAAGVPTVNPTVPSVPSVPAVPSPSVPAVPAVPSPSVPAVPSVPPTPVPSVSPTPPTVPSPSPVATPTIPPLP